MKCGIKIMAKNFESREELTDEEQADARKSFQTLSNQSEMVALASRKAR